MKPCTATQCGTEAALDLELCWSHRNRLQVDALDAVNLYDELLDIAANGTGTTSDGPRVTGGEERLGIELDEQNVEARHSIRRTLAYWAGIVYAQLPADTRGPMPVGLRECGRYVSRRASWLAAQVYAGDASNDLRDLVDQAAALVQRDPERSVRSIGDLVCPTCSAPVRAVMRRTTSLLASSMVCEADEAHRWMPHEWADLGDQAAGETMVDATVAGIALGYPPERAADNIYHLAKRGRLTRSETPDGPRYSLRQVQELAREWAA